MQEATVRLRADPRYRELEREWSRCMAEHGYEFQDRFDSVIEYFQPRLADLLSNRDETKLEELRREEIEVATVDLACTEPLAGKLLEVAAEYEQRLVEEAEGILAEFAELTERYGAR